MDYDVGAIALGMFPPEVRKAMIEFVQRHGPQTETLVQQTQKKYVLTEPCLGFLGGDLGPDVVANLARSIRIVLGDALAGQWSADKYALALSRAGSIPLEFARKLATDRIVTQDATVFDFARRLLYVIPDLPGPLDEAGRSILGGAIDVVERLLPTALLNQSGDVLYEWNNMGREIKELAVRSILTKSEARFEKAADVNLGDLKDSALATIPYLARALVGLLGHKLESGDLMSPHEREDIRDLLMQSGDLMIEAGCLRTPEQGSLFGKSFGNFLKKAVNTVGSAAGSLAPLAGGALGSMVGMPGLGAAAGKLLGGAISPHHEAALQGANAVAGQMPVCTLHIEHGDIYPTTLEGMKRSFNYIPETYQSNIGPFRPHSRRRGMNYPHD
jgi:hypothetical protein